MLDFSVHFQCYKNSNAVKYSLEQFRKYYPDNAIRLISDNGDDFEDIINVYNLIYKKELVNILPKGQLAGIDASYEYLRRIYDTCMATNTTWIVLFEDDVLTKGVISKFPETDCAGVCAWQLHPSLEYYLKNVRNTSTLIGYGMSGGSVFKREKFIQCYENIKDFDLETLVQFDHRLTGWTDILINVLFLYNRCTYSIWDEIEQYSLGKINDSASFRHDYKDKY